jgi:ferric-dicitrate binding protein FerR (iron transport regulator)
MQKRLHELVKRFLEGTATARERDEVNRLLETDVIDEIMQKELYRLQRKNLDNPFGLYSTSGVAPGEVMEARARRGPDEILDGRMPVMHAQPTPQGDHDIIEEIIHFRPQPEFKRIYLVAATVAALIAAIAFWWLTQHSDSDRTAQHNAGPASSEAEKLAADFTLYTGKHFVRLSDKTAVTLNKGTELQVGHTFGDGHREVTLRGEAYFDVHHDAKKPFIIHANGITVKVLGTAFNVRAYPGANDVKVTVMRGLVQVGSEEEVYSLVRPHEQISIALDTHEFLVQEANLDQTEDWRKRFLSFEDTRLEEVLRDIHDVYGVEVVLQRQSLKDCPLTATFSDAAPLEDVIGAVAQAYGMRYQISDDGRTVTLEDGSCR